MGLGTILLILLVIMLLASIPVYPYSRGWGYAPMGGLGAVLLIVILLVVTGVIPVSFNSGGGNVNVELPNVNVIDTDG